jgi:hypothetical protein
MKMRRYQHLLTPLSFLRVRSPDLTVYQWQLPAILAAIALIGYYVLPVSPPLFSEKGLVNTVNGLLNTLIGFFIAALAAVAAFPSASLDAEMKGRAPTIMNYRQDQEFEEKLTRRRFLVILFGYSAFLSIALFGFGVVSLMVSPSLVTLPGAPLLKALWLLAYLSMASSLVVSTLLGLHYLIDRMHRD